MLEAGWIVAGLFVLGFFLERERYKYEKIRDDKEREIVGAINNLVSRVAQLETVIARSQDHKS